MAGTKFAFYSTDIDPTTDPANAVPAPATIVSFERDPSAPEGDYSPMGGSPKRGTFFETLGGYFYQEISGEFWSDVPIEMSDTFALSQTSIDTLKQMHRSGEWYFTDGYDVWKGVFDKQRGLQYERSLISERGSHTRYSYSIVFRPTWKSGEL